MYRLWEKATNYQEREKGKTQPGTLCRTCYRRAIKDEREGRTCLIIAHRISTIKDADKIIVMENGKIVMEGPAKELKENPDIKEFYLGMGAGGDAKSYRDVKSYKRRKRWL